MIQTLDIRPPTTCQAPNCPYQTALHRLQIGTPGEALLEAYKPRPYAELINGKSVASAGCVPILHMRHFQKNKRLSDALVKDITSRHKA